MNVLFKTVHGSRLYNLHHSLSDSDFYTVVSPVPRKRKRYARQSIVDGIDTTVVDLGTWLQMCAIGVPQALEAMFSPHAIVDELWALRTSYRAGTDAWDRYLRTIKSFALHGDAKHRRHALRLAINFNDLTRTGRFNPCLSPAEVEWVNQGRHLSDEQAYELAIQRAWK